MTEGCKYKGDVLLNDDSIIKNVSTSFSSFASDELLCSMRSMALLSREYRQFGDKIDIDKLRHDLNIMPDTGGDAIDAYLEYRDYIQFMDKHANYDINRFKFVFTTDDSESHLVSTKGNVVDNIILPVVNDIACNDDKVIE